MQANPGRFDQFISRVLFITPPNIIESPEETDDYDVYDETEAKKEAQSAENAFGFSLFMSGVRCIIKYAILPFVLPIVGITGAFGAVISIAINLLAIGALIYSVRRFWQIDYKYKRQYLFVAVVTFVVLVAFTYFDVMELVSGTVV